MRIALIPFAVSGEVERNLAAIRGGLAAAAAKGADLAVFPECALCGYPPVETSILDEAGQAEALPLIAGAARQNRIAAAVGCVHREGERLYNSIKVYDKEGMYLGRYDKQALWGWDADRFTPGEGGASSRSRA